MRLAALVHPGELEENARMSGELSALTAAALGIALAAFFLLRGLLDTLT